MRGVLPHYVIKVSQNHEGGFSKWRPRLPLAEDTSRSHSKEVAEPGLGSPKPSPQTLYSALRSGQGRHLSGAPLHRGLTSAILVSGAEAGDPLLPGDPEPITPPRRQK